MLDVPSERCCTAHSVGQLSIPLSWEINEVFCVLRPQNVNLLAPPPPAQRRLQVGGAEAGRGEPLHHPGLDGEGALAQSDRRLQGAVAQDSRRQPGPAWSVPLRSLAEDQEFLLLHSLLWRSRHLPGVHPHRRTLCLRGLTGGEY